MDQRAVLRITCGFVLLLFYLGCALNITRQKSFDPFARRLDYAPTQFHRGDYAGIAFSTRNAKIYAEMSRFDRKEYLTFLRELQSLVPSSAPSGQLPADLQFLRQEEIIYGLFSFKASPYRLEGAQRSTEVQRFVEDIKVMKSSPDYWRELYQPTYQFQLHSYFESDLISDSEYAILKAAISDEGQ